MMSQKGRLINIDCVLCIDITNSYLNDGKPYFMSQMICRNTDRAKRLSSMFAQLFQEYCEQTTLSNGISLDFDTLNGQSLVSSHHYWNIDEDGNYLNFGGELKFQSPYASKRSMLKTSREFWKKWSSIIWIIVIVAAIVDILFIP